MKTYSIENLTEEQYRLILESILFSASTSVNSRWYMDNETVLMDIGLSLRKKNPNVLTKNIYILKDEEYHDVFSKKIIDFFPEILENISDL
jgi:hypothetical protein